MNFGKLLGAGKTFFGSGNGVTYRKTKEGYLPQFNAGKNPFANRLPEPVAVAASEIKKVPAAIKVQKFSPSPAPRPARTTGWAHKLNPFRTPPPEAPLMVNAVQPEFSLETVKVLHNDLSDCEVEMVPLKSHPLAAPKAVRGALDFLNEPVLKTF